MKTEYILLAWLMLSAYLRLTCQILGGVNFMKGRTL